MLLHNIIFSGFRIVHWVAELQFAFCSPVAERLSHFPDFTIVNKAAGDICEHEAVPLFGGFS